MLRQKIQRLQTSCGTAVMVGEASSLSSYSTGKKSDLPVLNMTDRKVNLIFFEMCVLSLNIFSGIFPIWICEINPFVL